MLHHTPKKRLIAIALILTGVLLLLLAIFFANKKTDTQTTIAPPNPSPTPISNEPPQITQVYNEQLGRVHGIDNQDELIVIPSRLTQKEEFIHADAYQSLMGLVKAAERDGIRLTVVSAYRSYDHQKRIWENKWGNAPDNDINQARQVLEYSSFPGTSRHHWGTDIDFNSVSLSYWQSDEGKKVHRWLSQNAPQYGFCQTYGDNRTQGYAVEDWHWSHMPTAEQYYQQISNPQILAIATSQPVRGAEAVRLLNHHIYGYIQGISPCHFADTVQMTIVTPTPTPPAQTPAPSSVTPVQAPTQLPSHNPPPTTQANGQKGDW